jgi:two-component system, OmpR family, response regulator ResD
MSMESIEKTYFFLYNVYMLGGNFLDKNAKILVVDDEERIRRLLKMYLERENYVIEEAEDGNEALEKALANDYDVILLDLMMPGKDGIDVCRELREKKATPVIMLTAKGEEVNRVQGFEVGTDDYIVKPFSPREVVLRVKALLRRSSKTTGYVQAETVTKDVIVFPHLTIDNDAHRVLADGQEVSLTPKEYELLFYLAKSPDKVFDREQLLKEVWHYEFFGDLRTVDTHVKRLREKLNKVSEQAAKMIITVWGVGYKFEVSNE